MQNNTFKSNSFSGIALACAMLCATLPAESSAASALAQGPTIQMPDFADLAERVGPSVVHIRTIENNVHPASATLDPHLEELLKKFGIPVPKPKADGENESVQKRATGSGFIISADGLIMTNAHVVNGAEEVTVTLTDKRELKATVVGLDIRTDIAIVKVEANDLPVVRIGNVEKLRVGEWVMAIGSPFGLENTVTSGIVSAKQRETGDFVNFIQSDVAINPGNSGGPLINTRGEVVGINSQIYSRSGGFAGISFSIPVNVAMEVARQLKTNGRVLRGKIGVMVGTLDQDVIVALGLEKGASGALIQAVDKDGPAFKAGLEAGDIVVKINNRLIEKTIDLQRLVGEMKPGTKAKFEIFRRGETKPLTIDIVESTTDTEEAQAKAAKHLATLAKNITGLTVTALNPLVRKELNLTGGVLVVSSEGPAKKAGIQAGDLIVSMNKELIKEPKQFSTFSSALDKTKPIVVMVRRGAITNYVVINSKED